MKRNLFDLETNTHTSTHAHTHRHTHTQTHTYIHPVLPFNTKLPFPLSSLSSLLRSCACGSLGYSGSLPLPASPSLSLAHTLFPPPSLVCSLPHTLSIKLTHTLPVPAYTMVYLILNTIPPPTPSSLSLSLSLFLSFFVTHTHASWAALKSQRALVSDTLFLVLGKNTDRGRERTRKREMKRGRVDKREIRLCRKERTNGMDRRRHSSIQGKRGKGDVLQYIVRTRRSERKRI